VLITGEMLPTTIANTRHSLLNMKILDLAFGLNFGFHFYFYFEIVFLRFEDEI